MLKEGGFEPKLYILDNEISQEFNNAIETNQMEFQLVLPNDHRRNVAKKTIQTTSSQSYVARM